MALTYYHAPPFSAYGTRETPVPEDRNSTPRQQLPPLIPHETPLYVPTQLAVLLGDVCAAVLLNVLFLRLSNADPGDPNVQQLGTERRWARATDNWWVQRLQGTWQVKSVRRRQERLQQLGILLRRRDKNCRWWSIDCDRLEELHARHAEELTHRRLEARRENPGLKRVWAEPPAPLTAPELLGSNTSVRLLYPSLVRLFGDGRSEAGVNRALLLHQIHYWTHRNSNQKRYKRRGRVWADQSVANWHRRDFPFLGLDAVRAGLDWLREHDYTTVEQHYSRTGWHAQSRTINHAVLTAGLQRLDQPVTHSVDQAAPGQEPQIDQRAGQEPPARTGQEPLELAGQEPQINNEIDTEIKTERRPSLLGFSESARHAQRLLNSRAAKEMVGENPARRAWFAVPDERLGELYRLAVQRSAADASKKPITVLKALLDTECGILSPAEQAAADRAARAELISKRVRIADYKAAEELQLTPAVDGDYSAAYEAQEKTWYRWRFLVSDEEIERTPDPADTEPEGAAARSGVAPVGE